MVYLFLFVCCFDNCTLQNRGKDTKTFLYTQVREGARANFIHKVSICTQINLCGCKGTTNIFCIYARKIAPESCFAQPKRPSKVAILHKKQLSKVFFLKIFALFKVFLYLCSAKVNRKCLLSLQYEHKRVGK